MADPNEMQHLAAGLHSYSLMSVLAQEIVLCNFCQVDFGSYHPGYFGTARRVDFRQMTLLREIAEPKSVTDKYCDHCGRRLAFLRFLVKVRRAPEAG